jgi:hypothetical protein
MLANAALLFPLSGYFDAVALEAGDISLPLPASIKKEKTQ